MKSPSILFWDIETSYSLAAVFGCKVDYISPSNIVQDWNITCIAYKWGHQKRVHAVSVLKGKNHRDDYKLVKEMREVLCKADIIVHHNGDKFDIKKFNARLIAHRLPPLPKKLVTIDTLKEARKNFAFTSNRLDFLGRFFKVGQKVRNPEGLWMDVLNGVKSAIKQMIKYCKQDVILLEEVFNVMKPYINIPQTTDGMTLNCHHCGGGLIKDGTRRTRAGLLKQKLRCSECCAYMQATVKKDGTLGRIGEG